MTPSTAQSPSVAGRSTFSTPFPLVPSVPATLPVPVMVMPGFPPGSDRGPRGLLAPWRLLLVFLRLLPARLALGLDYFHRWRRRLRQRLKLWLGLLGLGLLLL